MTRIPCIFAIVAFAVNGQHLCAQPADGKVLSHPPLRPLPELSKRPLTKGAGLYVDSAHGNDNAAGGEKTPWRTINHALKQLKAGDTLYLRGGVYREHVYCAVAGTKDTPITIRAFPGERVIIDGGLAEFFDEPAKAWTPFPQGAADEFRSVKAYRNIRDILGLFGDSHIALQTYWHNMDLRAKNELWMEDPDKKLMVLPVYCGPGLWYDRDTGHIHIRLAHTNLKTPGLANFRGETDPRKLPLVIAPFKATPLFVDMAKHVRFQDLVLRGGGHDCVVLQMGIDVEFDNVVIFAGTYGIRARSTGPFRMVNSAIHGMIPPWAWRDENSLFTYSPKSYDPFLPAAKPANERNIARLNTHALLVTEGTYEFEVFAYPFNHDWEISQCEFTDGHDGVYLSGRTIRFHHNLVDRMQDDGVYLSSPSNYFNDDIHIHHNLIRNIFTTFACNNRGGPGGDIFIYRNIIDQRQGVPFSRPSLKNPEGVMPRGHAFLAHGNDLLGIESLHFHQNTFITETWSGSYAGRTWTVTHPRSHRRIFNNLFVYLSRYPDPASPEEHDIMMDGNLHWCAAQDAKLPDGFLEKVRVAKGSKLIQSKYPAGWEGNSFVADPRFVAFEPVVSAKNDYRLKKGSAAVAKGVVLPKELPDPLRPAERARPDIGALPLGADFPGIGRYARIKAPFTGKEMP
ncbi:MAG: hypothetical protein HY040_22460 [Planctomycetes bacterium]|nr:hypothetical protein [Planctomycetota bacterium]